MERDVAEPRAQRSLLLPARAPRVGVGIGGSRVSAVGGSQAAGKHEEACAGLPGVGRRPPRPTRPGLQGAVEQPGPGPWSSREACRRGWAFAVPTFLTRVPAGSTVALVQP